MWTAFCVGWLVRQSLLADADVLSRQLSGSPAMWRNPYARPEARRAVSTASVWFTAYPISLTTVPFAVLHLSADLWLVAPVHPRQLQDLETERIA